MEFILASGSPRRHELLEGVGLKHKIIKAKGEEILKEHHPGKAARSLALQKASEVAENISDGCVLGADTVVSYDGKILGKPENSADAERMLHMLSGTTHKVYTGVAVIIRKDGEVADQKTFYEETKVEFYDLTDEEIQAYIRTGEPLDKAGSYGIQGRGAILVKQIEGDYFNVVGLPLARTFRTLKAMGVIKKEK